MLFRDVKRLASRVKLWKQLDKFFPLRFYCSVSNVRPLLPGILPCRLYILTHRFQLTVSSKWCLAPLFILKCTWDFPGIPGSSTPPLSRFGSMSHLGRAKRLMKRSQHRDVLCSAQSVLAVPLLAIWYPSRISKRKPRPAQSARMKIECITIHHTTSKKSFSTFAFPICSKGRTVLISFVRTGHFGLWKTMVKRNNSMI